MIHLERAHAFAHEAAWAIEDEIAPSDHLGPAAQLIADAVASIYDAFDARADRPTAIGVAHGRLFRAAIMVAQAGMTGAVESLRRACAELISAEERFPRVPLAGRSPSPLCAGKIDLPLHTVERASIRPVFRAPPAPEPAEELPPIDVPEPTTFEELAAAAAAVKRAAEARIAALTKPKHRKEKPAKVIEEAPPGFAIAPPAAITEDAFVQRWARECFEEIGMLGIQRAPLAGDDFRACVEIERRLVWSVDAFAALGPVALAYAEPLALDAPAADPIRVLAMTLIAGSFEGRDVLGGAERVLQRFGAGDEIVAGAFAAGMKVSQNPFTERVLRSLLTSQDRARRVIAIDVLGHRDLLTERDLEEIAGDDDPSILAVALPHFGLARHPDLGSIVARARDHEDLALREAALVALALASHRDAATAARSAAAGPLGDRALLHLAIVAGDDDARWIVARAAESRSEAAIEAAGWAGHVDAVPMLLSVLEGGEDDPKLAAAAALERLLGAKLVETIEVTPEEIDDTVVVDPDPNAKPPRKPLAELVSDPRFLPPQGAKEKIEAPSIDPEKWRAHWAEHGSKLDPKHRIRRGQPYSTSVSLYEIDQLALAPRDRRLLHRELVVRTGKHTRFDPLDFVAVQERCLKAWEAIVRAQSYVPGAFSRPIAR